VKLCSPSRVSTEREELDQVVAQPDPFAETGRGSDIATGRALGIDADLIEVDLGDQVQEQVLEACFLVQHLFVADVGATRTE
jgi:hypothetical protein